MALFLDTTTFYPPHIGGVEAWAAGLHRSVVQRQEGHSVAVATSAIPRTATERLGGDVSIARYRAVEPVDSFAFGRSSSVREAAARALGGRRPDVVVSHTRFYPASMVAGRMARSFRARWVHVEHGSSFVRAGNVAVRGVARAYDHSLGRSVLQRADVVIAISDAVATFIEQLTGRTATVVRRGIDMPPPRPLPVSDRPSRIVYVGRLVEAKGVGLLLRAFAKLGGTRSRLIIAGDGPDADKFAALATALGISDDVEFVGSVPPQGVSSLLTSSAVFVNPSFSEGLPTSVLEAAAHGVPIVATDVGGTREIVGPQTGWLVPARSVDALAQALCSVLADSSEAAARADDARKLVEEQFSWHESAERFLRACMT